MQKKELLEYLKPMASDQDVDKLAAFSEGDYDDCFNEGFELGYTQASLEIITIIEQLLED